MGSPRLTSVYVETSPLSTTLFVLFLKKSDKKFKSFPDMTFCFRLKIIPLCHTLSNVFYVSRMMLLTPNPSSNDLYILCVTDKHWLTQELTSLKLPDAAKLGDLL